MIQTVLYKDVRRNIKSGDLLAWSTERIRSVRDVALKLIQRATNSPYDHVGIGWATDKRVFTIEATPPHVRVFPLSRARPFYWIPVGLEWKVKYLDYLTRHVGEPYSYKEVIAAYFGFNKKDDKWQCAEFTRYFYHRVGLSLDFGYTPGTIVEAMLRHLNTQIYKVL